ncbi:MAG: class I SAM-dependent methyltransferase [Pseudomonadota bacterium]
MSETRLDQVYRPSHDEAARQAFVGAFKAHVNGPLEDRLGDALDHDLGPKFERETGASPSTREEATRALSPSPLYQTWGSLVYTSQDFLWESVGDTVDRVRPIFEARAEELAKNGPQYGSLTLNADLQPPEPIASREIHRQPGGYFFETDGTDLTSPLLYFASIELYRTAKGLGTGAATGEPAMAPYLLKLLGDRFPDIAPKRILDLGCGVGTETIALKQRFPDAEVHGLDLSGPFMRFGHLWAEEKGVELHFRQGDARDTGYPDGHFDLIFSHILFHETGHEVLPAIMAEARRLLAPGGVFFNADVAYQPDRIPPVKQATNGWQVDYNGEPFWNGFADTDVKAQLTKAGFTEGGVFADYAPLGAGFYYLFGAQAAA